MSAQLEISVADQNGNNLWLHGSQAEGLVLSNVSNGGNFEARYRLKRQIKLNYPDIGYNYDVRVSDNKGVFWRGRMDDIRFGFDGREEYVEITALGGGVGSDDQIFQSNTFPIATTIETCVDTVRTSLMPKVTASSLVTTSRTLNAALTVTKMRAREVLDLLVKFGNSANTPLLWEVYPDDTSSATYTLTLKVRPTAVDYTVRVEDVSQIGFGFTGRYYGNKQRVFYNSTSWVTAQDTTAQSTGAGGVNLIREPAVIEAPDVTNSSDATNIAQTALTVRKQLTVVSEAATITQPRAVQDNNRQTVPLWRVRAGKLLYIQGLLPASPNASTLDWHNSQLIVGTEWNDDTGELRLTFERHDLSLEGLIAKLTKHAEI